MSFGSNWRDQKESKNMRKFLLMLSALLFAASQRPLLRQMIPMKAGAAMAEARLIVERVL